MGKIEGIRDRLRAWRPSIEPAYITYADLTGRSPDPAEAPDERYELHIIESADHPVLARFAPPWQIRWARPRFEARTQFAIAVTDGERVAAHCWVAVGDLTGLANGVLSVRIRPDEAYAYDMYIQPEYRRGAMATYLGETLMHTFFERGCRYGITFVLHSNGPSVLWHHSLGFNWIQMVKVFHLGDRIWWKVPFSDVPGYGPASRRGRHRDADPDDYFGGGLLPQ